MEVSCGFLNCHLFSGSVIGTLLRFKLVYKDKERAREIAEKIVSTNDVVILCEVWSNKMRQLICKLVEETHPFVWFPAVKRFTFGSGLVFLSRFPIISVSFEHFQDLSGYDSLTQKGVAGVKIDGGISFIFAHVCSKGSAKGSECRERNFQQICKHITNYYRDANKLILAGDLVSCETEITGKLSEEYLKLCVILSEVRMQDALRLLHSNLKEDHSFTVDPKTKLCQKWGRPHQSVPVRSDLFFTRQIDLIECQVIEESELSDHFPIKITFKI